MKRFQKAKEIVQGEQFGNVIDFFQSVRGQDQQPSRDDNRLQRQTERSQQSSQRQQKPDYTPLYLMGVVAILVALIKK